MCISPIPYGGTYCTVTTDCEPSLGLVCSTSTACGCPTASVVGMCDCPKVIGNEKFWDGDECVDAGLESESCNSTGYSGILAANPDNQCQTLAYNIYCISGICQYLYFFIFNITQCFNICS